MDLSRFFKSADKDSRIQETILRVNPASKSFHTAECFRNCTDNRLIKNFDVAIFYSFVNVVHNVILQE